MRETIGHYRVLDRIGAGGLGEVYRARDTKLGRTVAVKAVRPEIAGDVARRTDLLRDARASAKLSHPNIVALYEIVEDGPDLFLVFDFASGEPLRSVVGGHALNPRRAVDIAIQIADALADVHADELVHGDLKPDNIIVTPRGNAKILDTGLSRWTRGGALRASAAQLRGGQPGSALATLAYLSPEQAVGEPGDTRSDIFSLGVMLFEMLTGQLPFGGTTPDAMTLQIAQAPAPAITSVNRSLPPELDAIVGRALSKSITDRYESAAALAAELRTVAAVLDVRATMAAEQSRPAPGIARPARRSGRWLVVAVAVALLAAAVWWWLRGYL